METKTMIENYVNADKIFRKKRENYGNKNNDRELCKS